MNKQSLRGGYMEQKAHGTALLLQWLWWHCGGFSIWYTVMGRNALSCGLQQHVLDWKGTLGLKCWREWVMLCHHMGCRLQVLPWCTQGFWNPGALGARWKHWVNKGKNCRNAWMVEWVLWKDLGIWMMLLKHCLGITCVGGGGQRWWYSWAFTEGFTKSHVLVQLFCYKMGQFILPVWGCQQR